jgi:hypothetical protein
MLKKNFLFHIISLAIGLVVAFLFLFVNPLMQDSSVDINIHDTYFVVDYSTLGIFVLMLHSIFAIVYFLIRNRLYNLLAVLHLLFTIPMYVQLLLLTYKLLSSFSSSHFTHPNELIDTNLIGNPIFLSTLLFMFAQLFFLANILLSVRGSVVKGK